MNEFAPINLSRFLCVRCLFRFSSYCSACCVCFVWHFCISGFNFVLLGLLLGVPVWLYLYSYCLTFPCSYVTFLRLEPAFPAMYLYAVDNIRMSNIRSLFSSLSSLSHQSRSPYCLLHTADDHFGTFCNNLLRK